MRKTFPFTVIYVKPEESFWRFINYVASSAEEAEAQCLERFPGIEVVWVNEGFDNISME